MIDAKIPKRYADVSIQKSDLDDKQKEVITHIANAKQSALFSGKTGSGKTHLAACIFNGAECNKAWFDASYYIYEMKRRMGLKTTDANTLIAEFWDAAVYTSLVVLDDLGTELQDSESASIISRILMDRYNNQKWTVITTNLDGKALEKRYSQRIISRIYEDYTVVVMNDKDRRKEKFKEVCKL